MMREEHSKKWFYSRSSLTFFVTKKLDNISTIFCLLIFLGANNWKNGILDEKQSITICLQ